MLLYVLSVASNKALDFFVYLESFIAMFVLLDLVRNLFNREFSAVLRGMKFAML